MVTFSDTQAPTNVGELQSLEQWLGLTLPDAYKQHLLQYNGGYCEPAVFDFVEKGRKTSSVVGWFLALYEGEYTNLRTYCTWYKFDEKRLPAWIVPFAHDPGGNLICLSCGADDYGRIYFWNHEEEVDYSLSPDTDYSNLYLIAESFEHFLQGLHASVE